MGHAYLMRTWYPTDVTPEDPEYDGAFSGDIPQSAFRDGRIVHVDWSERGVVEVTYLMHAEVRS